MGDLISGIVILIPIILGAFILRWIRIIRINSGQQIQQNKEIIGLLKKLEDRHR